MSVGSRFARSDPAAGEVLRRAPLVDALLAEYSYDAHAYLYALPGEPETRRHSDKHPHDRLEELRIDTLLCDLDNPDHAPWSSSEAATAALAQALSIAGTAGGYVTAKGLRLVQPLLEALPVLEGEGALRAWLAELERRGLRPDFACADWTRCFRLPHVRRDRVDYRSPLVEYARMRPIARPAGMYVARRRSGKGGPLVDVAQSADLPERWRELAARLRPVVAAEPRGVEDGWHRLALRITGTALGMGLRPELGVAFAIACFPEGADRANVAKAAGDTARRYASRRAVQGRRALEDAHPMVAAALAPPARAVSALTVLPPAAEASAALLEDLRHVRPGLRLVQAACGLGKTRAARLLAGERAGRGERTVISVPTHELAHQVVADLRGAGVAARRLFGPLSVKGDDGKPACRYHVIASRLAEGRQSVRALLCDTCEHRDGCLAVDAKDGEKDAHVVVGPHALLRSLVALAGAESLLVLDEPPPVTEQLVLRREHLSETESYCERFEPAYWSAVRPAVLLVRWWLELGPIGRTVHLSEAFDLELDVAAAQARQRLAEAVQGHAPPALRGSAARQCKWDPGLAVTLGRVSRTLDVVRRALLSLEARARIERVRGKGEGEHRQLALTLLREDLALALRRDGPTVVAAADVELHAEGYRAVSSSSSPVSSFAAGDGAPVERVQLALRATRTHWLPAPAKLDGPAYQALQLALVWLREKPFARAGIVTYQAIEERLLRTWRELLPPGVEVRHYGALRGLDSWKEIDAIVTLGDPFPPADEVEREALLLGQAATEEALRDRSRALAAAELEQAHGRLRAPHRTRPARALHVGQITPAGWVGHRVVEAPGSAVITPDEVRRLVEERGGARAVARLIGRSHVAVLHWASGARRCPAEVADWLRSRSGPSTPLVRDGAVHPSSLVTPPPLIDITRGALPAYYEGGVTTNEPGGDPEAA